MGQWELEEKIARKRNKMVQKDCTKITDGKNSTFEFDHPKKIIHSMGNPSSISSNSFLQQNKMPSSNQQCRPNHNPQHHIFGTTKAFVFGLLFLLTSFPSISICFSTLPSISPRFLHFSVQIRPEWLMDIENKILGVIESVEEGPNGWQISIQLYANQPTQSMPFTSTVNISRGNNAIRAYQIGECEPMVDGNIKSIQLEIELSKYSIFIRAKNAAKYILPTTLIGSAYLRVYFVRIEGNENAQKSCQLNSKMNVKETSRFALPSTTPHPAFINKSTTSTPPNPIKFTTISPKFPPILNAHSPIWNATIVEEENAETEREKIVALPKDGIKNEIEGKKKPPSEWPLYKRKRVKVPRRSTMAAQRFLSPNHYVPQKDWARGRQKQQQQQRIYPPRPTPAWNYGDIGMGVGEEMLISTTMANYIDIIRDRQLFEEVQRSRTMEINSRWSFIFLLFMSLIAVLISISAAFALIMFILLQCRPKPKKPLLVV